MARPLFDKKHWGTSAIPEPFIEVSRDSNEFVSKYNINKTKSTLHGPTLKALLAYADIYNQKPYVLGGVANGGNTTYAEYHSGNSIQLVKYDAETGVFETACFESGKDDYHEYSLDEHTGAALLFSMLPKALKDTEFSNYFAVFAIEATKGFQDIANSQAGKAALILCDNLYRRIISNSLPADDENIKLMEKAMFSPVFDVSYSYGTFQHFTPVSEKEKFQVGKYQLSRDRKLTPVEESMVPVLPDWISISDEAVKICLHAKETTGTNRPMRNFMMRGPSGTGKTRSSSICAAGLHLPYLFQTCCDSSDKVELVGQILPQLMHDSISLPSYEELMKNPVVSLFESFQIFDQNATPEAVYNKIKELVDMAALIPQQNGSFRYVDTPLMRAMRYGYLVELQEVSAISNQAVLVGLGSLLDDCASMVLPTGEVVHRHPDCVVIMTANLGYEGTQNMNQAVLSRMNLIIDVDAISVEEMTKRALAITGCTDKLLVRKMAQSIEKIYEYSQQSGVLDGVFGPRELYDWVQSYMISKNARATAEVTILSKATSDPQERECLRNTCVYPFVA